MATHTPWNKMTSMDMEKDTLIQQALAKLPTCCPKYCCNSLEGVCSCEKYYCINPQDPTDIVPKKKALSILFSRKINLIGRLVESFGYERCHLSESHKCVCLSNCRCGFLVPISPDVCQIASYDEVFQIATNALLSGVARSGFDLTTNIPPPF